MNQLISFLNQCVQSITVSAVVLSIGFVLFTLMERMFSLSTSKKPWRSTLIDLRYALLSMLYPPFTSFIISAVFGLLAFKRTAPSPGPGVTAFPDWSVVASSFCPGLYHLSAPPDLSYSADLGISFHPPQL